MKNNLAILPQILRTRASLALPVAKAFLSKLIAQNIDYPFAGGKSRRLALVTFRITPLCNQSCVMCSQRGKTGVLKGRYAQEEAKKIVPLQRYLELVDELARVNPILYVWGGEPFLYPHFMDLAQNMARKCPAFTVNTNGTYLARHAERIVRDQWGSVYISLDGRGEVNDAIRGKGSYQRVVEGIQAVNREKERQGSDLPYLGLVTTISNLNYLHLEEVVRAAREFKLSWHMINLGTYTNAAVAEKQRRFMLETFGVRVNGMEGFANGYNEGIDGRRFAEILARVQELDFGYPIITVPVTGARQIDRYYNELETPVRDHCICPWVHTDIDYNGDVHFCVDYPEYILGNIKEESFFSIYNNEKAVFFRQTLKKNPDGIFPGCTRCYQLMLLGRRRKGF